MFEYVFGFIAGTVTTYICLKGQIKQFDQVIGNIDTRLENIEEKL